MAVNLQSTSDQEQMGVKMLVYGMSGAGKTRLIPTLPNPVIFSVEGGLLSIEDHSLPFIDIKTFKEMKDARDWLRDSSEAAQFESVAIDSISEIAEVLLFEEKKSNADGRKAYGNMSDQIDELIRSFKKIPKHVYMTAKLDKAPDEMGRIFYCPSLPGKTTTLLTPYHFDGVYAYRVEKDADGNIHKMLMCHSDGLWDAKDRTGKLDAWEEPDLGKIIAKINAPKEKKE